MVKINYIQKKIHEIEGGENRSHRSERNRNYVVYRIYID